MSNQSFQDSRFLKDSTFWRYVHTFTLFGLLFGFAGLLKFSSTDSASTTNKKKSELNKKQSIDLQMLSAK